jgi:hypothetical protein
MKKLGFVIAMTMLGATAASAQGIQLQLGPDRDRGWDDNRREERVITRERGDRDFDRDRGRRGRDVLSTGSTGCRTTIVKREDDRGRMVTRRIRECD